MQPVSTAHTFDPVIFLNCLRKVFTTLTVFRFITFRLLLIRNISFSGCFVCIFLFCRPELVLGLFILSISILFGFISSSPLSLLSFVSFLKEKKDNPLFVIEYFLGIFGTGLIFKKNLEVVISLEEVSLGNEVGRVLNP